MPITNQAIKKLRHDRAVTVRNEKSRNVLAMIVKKARKGPSAKTLTSAFSALDSAVKHHLIHKNSAARTKSRLSKLIKK